MHTASVLLIRVSDIDWIDVGMLILVVYLIHLIFEKFIVIAFFIIDNAND
jgi:hypothetical protein